MELHSLNSGTGVAPAQGGRGGPAPGRRFDAVISDRGIQLSEVDAAPQPAAAAPAADVEAESGPDRPMAQMNEDWIYTQRGANARAPAVSPLGQTLDVTG